MRFLQCKRCNEAFGGHYQCCPDCLGPLVALSLKQHKYRAKAVEIDGIRFASQKEAKRWAELVLLEKAGQIRELKRQVSFDLVVNGELICRYVSDATYVIAGVLVVEDTKSPITRKNRAYRIKVKLLRACHSIEVHET